MKTSSEMENRQTALWGIVVTGITTFMMWQTFRVWDLELELKRCNDDYDALNSYATSVVDTLQNNALDALDLAEDFNRQRDSIYLELEKLRRQRNNTK